MGSEKIMRWFGRWLGLHQVPDLDTISMKFTYKGLEFHLGSFFHKKNQASPRLSEEQKNGKGKTIWKRNKKFRSKAIFKGFWGSGNGCPWFGCGGYSKALHGCIVGAWGMQNARFMYISYLRQPREHSIRLQFHRYVQLLSNTVTLFYCLSDKREVGKYSD